MCYRDCGSLNRLLLIMATAAPKIISFHEVIKLKLKATHLTASGLLCCKPGRVWVWWQRPNKILSIDPTMHSVQIQQCALYIRHGIWDIDYHGEVLAPENCFCCNQRNSFSWWTFLYLEKLILKRNADSFRRGQDSDKEAKSINKLFHPSPTLYQSSLTIITIIVKNKQMKYNTVY